MPLLCASACLYCQRQLTPCVLSCSCACLCVRFLGSLFNNSIGDEGAKAIVEALAANQSLTSLKYAAPLHALAFYSPLLSAAADKPLTHRACFLADVLAFVCASLAACMATTSVLRVRRRSEGLWPSTRASPPSRMPLPYMCSLSARLYCQQPLTLLDPLPC